MSHVRGGHGSPCWHCALPRQGAETPLSPPTMRGHSQEARPYQVGRGFLLGTESASTPIADFEPPGP